MQNIPPITPKEILIAINPKKALGFDNRRNLEITAPKSRS
jgi:hypothetical protein